MSGEFRWTNGGYFYSVISNIDEAGSHPLSMLLYDIYEAVSPLERECAWVEACDSSDISETVLADQAAAVIEACDALKAYMLHHSPRVAVDGDLGIASR